jgi:hypothetical protein
MVIVEEDEDIVDSRGAKNRGHDEIGKHSHACLRETGVGGVKEWGSSSSSANPRPCIMHTYLECECGRDPYCGSGGHPGGAFFGLGGGRLYTCSTPCVAGI